MADSSSSNPPRKPSKNTSGIMAAFETYKTISKEANVISVTGGNSKIGTENHNQLDGVAPGIKVIASVVVGDKIVEEQNINHGVPGYTVELVGGKTDITTRNIGKEKTASNAEETLPTNKYKTGLALLINNKFDTPPKYLPRYVKRENYVQWGRNGAEKDTELMSEKFEQLTGNPVSIAENVQNADDLSNYLDEFKEQIREKNPDYIVLIISTHGGVRNHLLLDNLKPIDLYNDIVYQFDSNHFKGFEKPKVFLVQACQKGDISRLNADGAPASVPPEEEEPIQYRSSKSQIFVGQSTVPNEPAYRDDLRGSLYIQAIHKRFCKGKKLETLLKEVDAEVNQTCGKEGVEQNTSIWKRPDFPEDFCF